MPNTSIRYDQQKNIVYTRQEGNVTAEERMQLIKEMGDLSLSPGVSLLSDVRDLTCIVAKTESQPLLDAYKATQKVFRKVAILHREKFPPYTILASDAIISGINVEEFTSLEDAELWLKM